MKNSTIANITQLIKWYSDIALHWVRIRIQASKACKLFHLRECSHKNIKLFASTSTSRGFSLGRIFNSPWITGLSGGTEITLSIRPGISFCVPQSWPFLPPREVLYGLSRKVPGWLPSVIVACFCLFLPIVSPLWTFIHPYTPQFFLPLISLPIAFVACFWKHA